MKNRRRPFESWRHVYFYLCTGCGKKRATFNHERALSRTCSNCTPKLISPDQMPLIGAYTGDTPNQPTP